jgi:hypothetical protein
MRDTRAMLLADLRGFERDQTTTGSRQSVQQWIQYTIDRYERWIKRLAP